MNVDAPIKEGGGENVGIAWGPVDLESPIVSGWKLS
jgi:hypothetical protein